jgi:hypothetical protein
MGLEKTISQLVKKPSHARMGPGKAAFLGREAALGRLQGNGGPWLSAWAGRHLKASICKARQPREAKFFIGGKPISESRIQACMSGSRKKIMPHLACLLALRLGSRSTGMSGVQIFP